MHKINTLSPNTIAKIAAGEVVERPASVVKELIENSIDAGASSIHLLIKQSGKLLIEVRDDGEGMNRADAQIAFDQHTTSKINSEKDLDKIITLGFRGEALSSIAAVADIELNTTNKNESTKLEIVNQTKKITAGSPTKGTSIKVKKLFGRIPARKKFLRTDSTEFKHILDIFTKHALANPSISFKLTNEGKLTHNLPKADLKTRIFDLWGNKYNDSLGAITFDSPNLKIEGLIAGPNKAQKNRRNQFIFLNERPIESDLISKAVENAFHSTHPERRYPVFWINIVIDPQEIDVNVHPRKLEVKFQNTQRIFTSVKQATEKAITDLLQNTVKHRFSENKQTFPSLSENKIHYNTKSNHRNAVRQNQEPNINQTIKFSKSILTPSQPIHQTKYIPTHEEPGETNLNKAFQIFNTYLIIEKQEKLLIIDQHAADERINYEKILAQAKDKNKAIQSRLVPETVELEEAQIRLLRDHLPKFKEFGLDIELFGAKMIKLNSHPAILKDFDFESFLEDILENEIIQINKNEILHRFVATLACHGSIRAGRKMHQIEIQKMIEDLFKCEKPYSCPHGRPIIWELTRYEIEKEFKRTGF